MLKAVISYLFVYNIFNISKCMQMKETDLGKGKEKGYEVKKDFPFEHVEISAPVMDILGQYGRAVNQEITTVERAKQLVEIVRDFTGEDAPAWIIDATALAGIAEYAAKDYSQTSEKKEKEKIIQARKHINRYMLSSEDESNECPNSKEIVKTLAALSYVENELGGMRSIRRGIGQVTGMTPDQRLQTNTQKTHAHKEREGVDEPWDGDLENVKIADPEKVLNLTNQKMFAPLLIKAAIALQALSNRGDITKASASRHARDALEVYAPFCETIGYDGEALALNNGALGAKFENSVHHEKNKAIVEYLVTEHERLLKGSGKFRAIAQLFDDDSLKVRPVVNSKSKSHEVKLGTFEATFGDINIDGRYRAKGIYSLLDKVFNRRGGELADGKCEMPMDLLGLTCITKDKEESAELISRIFEKISTDDNFQPKPVPERAKYEQGYIHVQGTEEYLRTICGKARFDRSKISHVTVDPDDFEVAKLTFMIKSGDKWIPTELQILTKHAREEARVGIVSHILFKLFGRFKNGDGTEAKRRESSRILRTIKAQKKEMKDPMPTMEHMVWFVELCQRAGV